MSISDTCFHCALPNPAGADYSVTIEGVSQAVCCPGCKAVAELIRDTGMSSYYALRDAPEPGVGKPAEEDPQWQVFNSSDMLGAFATLSDDQAEATIYAGGMYCSACSWLLDTSLCKIPGVVAVDVNPITHRLRVRWQHRDVGLGDLLAAMSELGYRPQPLTPDDTTHPEVAEQRSALKRLLVASLGMMQVMMFAVGLYAGSFHGIDADMQRFLRLISFFVATPVVFYAARPFFGSAWRGILARKPGMDLPVSIAIGAAYTASVYATFTNGPAVWFDSVAMFVFFLTLGRYLEMRARHRSIDRSAALLQVLPNTAMRVVGEEQSVVPVSQIAKNDVVIVRAGDSIPADGIIISGSTSIDESLLSGEADPQTRHTGDLVAAGSINIEGLIRVRVDKTGSDTTLGAISRLSERAKYTRPTFVTLADSIASYVVVALLFTASVVALYWYFLAPEKAFVITLSVLVVTCPCALALATPAAFAAAASRLTELQLLITNGNSIEVLSSATHMIFDKTGTLTRGRPVINSIEVLNTDLEESRCLAIATALERASSHPIALAFRSELPAPQVTEAANYVGQGVAGIIQGQQWRLGKAAFALDAHTDVDSIAIFLSVDGQAAARFEIRDELRPDAKESLDALRAMGIELSLASGDHEDAVEDVARALAIADSHFGCSPEQKLQIIESMQAAGHRVVMVGDGINDAPVLAGADASIAPAHGAQLAQTSADLIMLGESLWPIVTSVRLSRATMRIVRQNLLWAVVYNATALPLAVAGMVPPWLAAIGMSASSLIVVLNALRLNRSK